jgi:hypothetical protein
MGPTLQHSGDCAYAPEAATDRSTEVDGTKSSRVPAADPFGPCFAVPLRLGTPALNPARF